MLPKYIFKHTASNVREPEPAELPEQWTTYENMVAMFNHVIKVD